MTEAAARSPLSTRAFNARHVRNALSEAILTGEFGSEPLPDEAELSRTFQVSRNVVRAALDELRTQGMLVRITGRGTFALPAKVRQPIDTLLGLQELLGERLVYELVDANVYAAPASIAQTLGLQPGEEVHHLERLGRADGVRVVLTSTYIPVSIAPDLRSWDPRLMRSRLAATGQSPAEAEVELNAVGADSAVAGLLGVECGEPLLFFRRVMRRDDGTPVELCYSHYRSTAITLVANASRPGEERA